MCMEQTTKIKKKGYHGLSINAKGGFGDIARNKGAKKKSKCVVRSLGMGTLLEWGCWILKGQWEAWSFGIRE